MASPLVLRSISLPHSTGFQAHDQVPILAKDLLEIARSVGIVIQAWWLQGLAGLNRGCTLSMVSKHFPSSPAVTMAFGPRRRRVDRGMPARGRSGSAGQGTNRLPRSS